MATYRFQTLGEFRALLSLYNIGIEEVRGERNGTPYRGLLYTLLDENGDKAVAAPLKSSLFGKEVGYDGLERHMERSAVAGSIKRFGENPRRKNCANACGEPGWISTYDATKTAASWV